MFGLSSMSSGTTRWSRSSVKTACCTREVSWKLRSIVWSPSISTSGSTIGTSPASCDSAAKRARACAFVQMQYSLGVPAPLEELREGRVVGRALPDRLVEEDHAADVLLDPLGREEEVAVGAAVLLRRLDGDRVEALLDRPVALVGGEDSLVLGDQRAGGRLEVLCSHSHPSRISRTRPQYP